MGVKVAVVAAAGLLALVTACSGGTNAAGPPSSTASTATETSTSEPATAPSAGECPVGEYEVSTISGKSGTEVNGVPIVATSGGGLTLRFDPDGTWTLTGDGATVTLEASGISVDATVDGTAEGRYVKAGNDYAFEQEKATGKVTLRKPIAGISSLSMDEVGPALAPSGTATLTCGPDTLKITSDSVVLDLKRTGGAGGGTPSSSEAPAGGGGSLTINESGKNQTIACTKRNVSINGSANELTLTGSCDAVTVNGSRNTVRLEVVRQITVNGGSNTITYTGSKPQTNDNGTGNKISQG